MLAFNEFKRKSIGLPRTMGHGEYPMTRRTRFLCLASTLPGSLRFSHVEFATVVVRAVELKNAFSG